MKILLMSISIFFSTSLFAGNEGAIGGSLAIIIDQDKLPMDVHEEEASTMTKK